MSDLTDHQRKAGRTKTEKKTAASRATIAEARKVLKAKRDAAKAEAIPLDCAKMRESNAKLGGKR